MDNEKDVKEIDEFELGQPLIVDPAEDNICESCQ